MLDKIPADDWSVTEKIQERRGKRFTPVPACVCLWLVEFVLIMYKYVKLSKIKMTNTIGTEYRINLLEICH